MPCDEFLKRFDDGAAERTRRRVLHTRLAHEQRCRNAREHEQRGDRKHAAPGQMVGEYQRQRAGDQAGDAIRLNVYRIAQTKLGIREDLAPIRVEHDVLRRREKRDRGREIRDRPEVELRLEGPEDRDRQKQQKLRQQHPAAAASEHRQRIPVDQR